MMHPNIRLDGDSVLIPLGKGKRKHRLFAKIDRDDFERVIKHKWYALASSRTYYARATSIQGMVKHQRHLHLFIMRAKPGERFDHENGDGLDCRKENLRPATSQQNSFNSLKTNSPHVTSKFKGVSRSPSSEKWLAQIRHNGVPQALGLFEDEADAARAYDAAAVRLFGTFAKTNADMGLYESDTPVRAQCGGTRDYTGGLTSDMQGPPNWERFLATGERYVDKVMPAWLLAHSEEERSAVAKFRDVKTRRKILARWRKEYEAAQPLVTEAFEGAVIYGTGWHYVDGAA